MWERRTCFTSESISSSFCFICARRYSRLLKGENENSSSSEEETENEEVRERGGIGILGGVGMKWGLKIRILRRAGESIKMDATGVGQAGEDHSLWSTPGFPAFDNTFVLARSAALAYILPRRKEAFHLMSARDRELELSKAGRTTRERAVPVSMGEKNTL
jgi:hypothetical protein